MRGNNDGRRAKKTMGTGDDWAKTSSSALTGSGEDHGANRAKINARKAAMDEANKGGPVERYVKSLFGKK